MLIVDFGRAIEGVMPVFLMMVYFGIKDRIFYFGLSPDRPIVRDTALRLVLPGLFGCMMLFLWYCSILNNRGGL